MHRLQLRRDCDSTAARFRATFVQLSFDARKSHGRRIAVRVRYVCFQAWSPMTYERIVLGDLN